MTRIEPHRNEENVLGRNARRYIKRIAQFALEMPALHRRAMRKAAHEEIRQVNRTLDCSRPVLAGQQFLLVHPRLKPGPLQGGVEFAYLRLILLRICQENAPAARWL